MLGSESISNLLPLIVLCLITFFLWSFEPLPPSSKNYSFTDYLLEGGYYKNWQWFVGPVLFLFIGDIGGDLLRNVREMPLVGWIILAGSEIIIYQLLYWRYKNRKQSKR
jgi:hypothetical protein